MGEFFICSMYPEIIYNEFINWFIRMSVCSEQLFSV